MYLNLETSIAIAERSTRLKDLWARHTNRLGDEKWRSVSGLRHLQIVSHQELCLPYLARAISHHKLSCISSQQSKETRELGDHGVYHMSMPMLDIPWNGQHANFKRSLQDVALSHIKIMASANSSPGTSYVPSIFTMETGKDFHDNGDGPFLTNGICGRAMSIV